MLRSTNAMVLGEDHAPVLAGGGVTPHAADREPHIIRRQPLRQMQDANVQSSPPTVVHVPPNQHQALLANPTGGQIGVGRHRSSPLRANGHTSENTPPMTVSPSRHGHHGRARGRHGGHERQAQLHPDLSFHSGSATALIPEWKSKGLKVGEVTSKELRKLSWIQPTPNQPTARRLFSSPHVHHASPHTPKSRSFRPQQKLAFSGLVTPALSGTSRDSSTTELLGEAVPGSAADSREIVRRERDCMYTHLMVIDLGHSTHTTCPCCINFLQDFSLDSSPSSTSSRRQRRIMIQIDSPERSPRSPPLHTSSPASASKRRARRLVIQADSSEQVPMSPPMLRRSKLLTALTSDCMQTDF
eukprot:m.14065 g.14065  ORF g.14065 m.14065 type:complete len:357 (+) comp8278_c0_seq1:213-1283(+)